MSNTMLKIIAMVAMIFDHLWRFFPNSPYFFHWIGRISAPIFLFCCVLGYVHTSNKKRFFIRIYSLSIIVEFMNLILKIDDLRMNFIRTIFLVTVIIFIIDKFREKNKNAKIYLYVFIGWQIITTVGIYYLLYMGGVTEEAIFLITSLTANIMFLDGGILFVLMGVLMFIFKDNKLKFSISFIILTGIYVILFNSPLILKLDRLLADYSLFYFISYIILGVHPMAVTLDILFVDPQWMMIFSLPFIFMYNGKKGRGLKYLFYIFYPLHIAILYICSMIFR